MPNTTASNLSYAHGHVALFYDAPDQLMQLLAKYMAEGMERGELCIMAAAQPIDQLIDDFREAGLFVASSIATGHLRLFEMDDIYVPEGVFVANQMLDNVRGFIDDALSQGYTGLRAAGDMTWIGRHPEAQSSAADYESNITKLGKGHGHFMGMCLYPLQEKASILQDALRTHPTYMYDGILHMNRYAVDNERDPSELHSHEAIRMFLAAT